MATKETTESKQTENSRSSARKLYRSRNDRIVAGVAGGIAEYFEIDSSIVRFIFFIMIMAGGTGLLLYLGLWLILPVKDQRGETPKEQLNANIAEMKQAAESFTKPLQKTPQQNQSMTAYVLIAIGAYLLLLNFGYLEWIDLEKWWPATLVLLGFFMLTRRR